MTVTENEQQLIDRWIDLDPYRGRAEARLKRYGNSIWVLASYWYHDAGGVDAVAKEYDLPHEAVEAAYAYYRRHKKLVDARILLNEDCFDE